MRRILPIFAFGLFMLGCGADEPTSPTPPPNDGKLHPTPSGERIAEAAACSALADAHSKTLLAVGCVGTTQSCPTLLRLQSGSDCLQYDKGSLDGCVAHIKEQTMCMAINASVNECVVFSYAGSAPTGCP